MANSIVAYDRPTDVDVVMSIERPKPTVGLGNLLINYRVRLHRVALAIPVPHLIKQKCHQTSYQLMIF